MSSILPRVSAARNVTANFDSYAAAWPRSTTGNSPSSARTSAWSGQALPQPAPSVWQSGDGEGVGRQDRLLSPPRGGAGLAGPAEVSQEAILFFASRTGGKPSR